MDTVVPKAKLQPQFSTEEQQERSVQIGMWLFLATEVLFFGVLFLAYAIYRFRYEEAFAAGSHHLDLRLGTLNTALLLLSSFLVALAVTKVKAGATLRWARWSCLLAALIGVAFLSVKGYEWHHVWKEGLFPGNGGGFGELEGNPKGARMFFTLYFVMTALHGLHVLIGALILFFLGGFIRGNKPWEERAGNRSVFELSGLYWHFVDIVWLFLFPLLYLIERGGS